MKPLEKRIYDELKIHYHEVYNFSKGVNESAASSIASLMEEEMKGLLKWYLESSYVVISSPHEEPIFINSETSSGERYNLKTLLSLYLLSLEGNPSPKQ